MRVIFSSLVALSISLFAGAEAAGELDAATNSKLVQLEQKYFGHAFQSEDADTRTQRLEKMIFGDPVEGDPQKRIQNLAATTDSAHAFDSGTPRVPEPIVPKSKAATPSAKTANSQPADDPSTGGAEQYPHINELERSILGRSYDGQPLADRLGRMELKAFGSPSNIPDFSDRTDVLDSYVAQHTPRRSNSMNGSVQTTEASDSTAGDAQNDYPRVTALESEILGQSFQGQSLTARLSRMEAKAFGKPSDDMDLSERTDALDKYAQTKLHKHLHEQPSTAEAAPDGSHGGSGRGAQVAAGVGRQLAAVATNTLLGMAGVRGVGFGGMGGPGGFGGGSSSPRTQPTPTDGSERMDDPAVFAQEPPPPEARMITKVGWCEQQVFGHTFGNMHLTERLEQLNGELQFERGKSGSELMDRMASLIKTVRARKQLPAPIGYASQPATH